MLEESMSLPEQEQALPERDAAEQRLQALEARLRSEVERLSSFAAQCPISLVADVAQAEADRLERILEDRDASE